MYSFKKISNNCIVENNWNLGYPHIALLTIVQGVEIVILESPKCIRLLPIKVFLTFFFFFTFFF